MIHYPPVASSVPGHQHAPLSRNRLKPLLSGTGSVWVLTHAQSAPLGGSWWLLDVCDTSCLSSAAVAESQAKDQVARKAGRGFAFILAAKLYFLAAGYAIVVTLSWVLGPALYGAYGLVVGAISVLDNVIVTGTIQTVSRFTAEEEGRAGAVKAAALKLQLLLGGGVAVIFALCAPLVAAFERDASLTPYLRLAAVIVLFYALYSVFIGSANGLRRFGTQATLDVLYATLRSGLIVGLASAGYAVWGAVGGFVAAAIIIVIISAIWLGVRDLKGGFSSWTLVRFAFPVMAYLLLVNLTMFMDLFLLKRLAAEVAVSSAVPEGSHEMVGSYVAVQQLARIPYQALLAVTFVVFPLVSRSTFIKDFQATKSYVASTMRYSLILGAAIAVSFVALPSHVMAVPFPAAYQIGADALAALAPGYIAFALFVVGTTILNAAGRPKLAFILTAVMLIAVVSLCWLLLPQKTTASGMLVTAAASASMGMAVGFVLISCALYGLFGTATPLSSLIRVGVAFGGATIFGRVFLPVGSRLVTLGECVITVGIYLVLLIVVRELRKPDIDRLFSVFRRRR